MARARVVGGGGTGADGVPALVHDAGDEQRIPFSPIHLIVRVERKTPALESWVSAIDRALVQDYARQIGPDRLAHLLDVQVVDNSDVEKRIGAAAQLRSVFNRPLRIWTRA